MSDYCTKCSHEKFGNHVEPDIDVKSEFAKLKEGSYIPVLCEGCGMLAIGNNLSELLIAYPVRFKGSPRENFDWITYKEYEENVEPLKLYDPIKHTSTDN